MTLKPLPITISQLRKQILRSYIPLINSLLLIKFSDTLTSEEIVGFFKNANYTSGKIIQNGNQQSSGAILLVLNVERPFMVKYSKFLNLDGFEILHIDRYSESIAIESVQYEGIRINDKGRFQAFEKSIINFGSDRKSFIKELFKLKGNSKFKVLPSKYKNMTYEGKRVSFCKSEIEILEDYDEIATNYKMEIIDRQKILKEDLNLSESFKWKNRGIVNNMVSNLLNIEKDYQSKMNKAI